MRFLLLIVSALFLAKSLWASAESENEPAKNQMDVIARALQSLQESKLQELTPHFNESADTGYYLKEISFLGRFSSSDGYRLLFQAFFIRSSPYRESAVTPPRGHSFLVLFDESFRLLAHHRIEFDSKIAIIGGEITCGGLPVFDFRSPKTK